MIRVTIQAATAVAARIARNQNVRSSHFDSRPGAPAIAGGTGRRSGASQSRGGGVPG